MLAGVTRIIEICFFSPKASSSDVDDDNRSDRTLGGTGLHASPTDSGTINAASRAFRHLPPFVSTCVYLALAILSHSNLSFVASGLLRVNSLTWN